MLVDQSFLGFRAQRDSHTKQQRIIKSWISAFKIFMSAEKGQGWNEEVCVPRSEEVEPLHAGLRCTLTLLQMTSLLIVRLF